MEKLLKEKQVSELTGLALQTLRNARFEGRGFPYYRLGNGKRAAVRYSMADVKAYLDAHRIDPEEVRP